MCKILPRIKKIAQNEGITIGALERLIGASKGVLSRAIANGTDIQSKWLEAIVENYPQYSAQWLLSGIGDMIIANHTITKEAHNDLSIVHQRLPRNEKNNELRPRIPMNASAGSLSSALDGVAMRDCEMLPIIPTFPKYDFTIVARGDSMLPDLLSGDELACRFIRESSFIQWGRTHVLDTAQGIVVKRIFEKKEAILCRSNNVDYPDFIIPKEDIFHIAIVVGLIRQL